MKQKAMKRIMWGMVLSVLAAGSANAALYARVPASPHRSDYQAYYDTELNITWLADANYAKTSGYDSDGLMTWDEAQAWIGSLNAEGGGAGHLGVNDWRLPLTAQPDASCSSQSLGQGFWVGCTGSEMGHLYKVDGIRPAPFNTVLSDNYWSATAYAPDPSKAWRFYFGDGFQFSLDKSYALYAWAVRSGDIEPPVNTVPAPGALWLFGTGVVALGAKLKRRVRSAGTAA